MIAGHTKFSPDGNFETIKKAIRAGDCYSIKDLLGPSGRIHTSAYNNLDLPYKDPITSNINYEYYNWKEFLSQYFASCTGIRDWHLVKIPQEATSIFTKHRYTPSYES